MQWETTIENQTVAVPTQQILTLGTDARLWVTRDEGSWFCFFVSPHVTIEHTKLDAVSLKEAKIEAKHRVNEALNGARREIDEYERTLALSSESIRQSDV